MSIDRSRAPSRRRRFPNGFAVPRWGRERPDARCGPPAGGRRGLRVYFVKPSKYDDEGFVLRYRWGVIPNNTLIVLAGLNAAYARQRPEIEIQTVLWDEMVDGTLSVDVVASIGRRARADGVDAIVGLAGVQTNQYPRARDVALECRQVGLTVLMGGFHVSSHEPSRQFLRSIGVTVVVGEAETTWARIIDDYLAADLKPLYRIVDGLSARTGGGEILVPSISEAALPTLDGRYLGRFFNPTFSTIDTSRGCPFVCSYCSVKNVMGRTMRVREPARVVEWMRDAHDRMGVRNVLIVDDDFFRSPAWEDVLLGMARLRREGRDLSCILQTDIEAAALAVPVPGERETERQRRSRKFIELAAEAGCFEAFMGFESFDPRNLEGVAKLHNEEKEDRGRAAERKDEVAGRVRERYRRAVANWHRVGVGVHAGYIIGMPLDAPGCGRRAAEGLRDIGVDIASFFAYTPLPGTEEHARTIAAGGLIDSDFNDFDSTHFVGRHPRMSADELEREYRDAYRHFYTWRRLGWSMGTLHRVAGLSSAARYGMLTQQLYFTYATRRGWHPMIGGIYRLREEAGRRRARSDEDALRLYGGLETASGAAGRGAGPELAAARGLVELVG